MSFFFHGPTGPVAVKRMAVNFNSSSLPVVGGETNGTLIAAVPGRRILLLSFLLVTKKATTLTFKSGTTTLLTGPMDLNASQSISLATGLFGNMETNAGEALTVSTTGTNQILAGFLIYVEW